MTGRPTTIPILPSADLPATARFYAGLGFREAGHWPTEYLILVHEVGIELHFWMGDTVDRWTNDVACYVRFPTAADARALHDAWAAIGVPHPADLRPPRGTAYGLLEFALIDLHGNLVRVGGDLDTT